MSFLKGIYDFTKEVASDVVDITVDIAKKPLEVVKKVEEELTGEDDNNE